MDAHVIDQLLVPYIVWEEPRPTSHYVPCVGDVLITLVVNNVAETSFWTRRMPPTITAIRAAWIVAVQTMPSSEVGMGGLDSG
jgi:hypothetical protein